MSFTKEHNKPNFKRELQFPQIFIAAKLNFNMEKLSLSDLGEINAKKSSKFSHYPIEIFRVASF